MRLLRRLTYAVVLAIAVATLALPTPAAHAAAKYSSQYDFADRAYSVTYGPTSPHAGHIGAETNIVAPGRHAFFNANDFADEATVDYFAKFGFDRNFMYWARIQTQDLESSTFSYCTVTHGPGARDFCPAPAGNPWQNIAWDQVDDVWEGNTTVKINPQGDFIAAVCGNFSPGAHNKTHQFPKIQGTKFEDANGNRVRDGGEPGVGGVWIQLRLDGVMVDRKQTDANGYYSFDLNSNANPAFKQGTYTAVEEVPAGYVKTTSDPSVYVPYADGGQTYTMADIGNRKQTDVQVTKTSLTPVTTAGLETTWRLDIRNNGPWDAPSVTVTDTVPTAYSAITSTTGPCTFAGRALTCSFGTIANQGTRSVTFRSRSKPDLANGSTITNCAHVSTTMQETTYANNDDCDTTTVRTEADVSVVKSADHGTYRAGDVATFTLRVRNDGPSWARSVSVADVVPTDFVPTAATVLDGSCTVTGQQVVCTLGDMVVGEVGDVTIRTTTAGLPVGAGETTYQHEHQLSADKEELAWTLEAGESGATYALTCPNGRILTDLSWNVTGVDQGTGRPSDVVATRLVSTSATTGEITLTNHATGRAQGAFYAVCLTTRTTTVERHTHDLLPGAPVSTGPVVLGPGRTTVAIDVPDHETVIAPGFEVLAGDARLWGSELTPTGWELEFDVPAGSTATVRGLVRTLARFTSTSSSPMDATGRWAPEHAHTLTYVHLVQDLSAPVGRTTARLTCPDDYKGITATYRGFPWSVPEPVSRTFTVDNPGPDPIDGTIDLVCLDMSPGPVVDDPHVTNTGTVTSPTEDVDLADNQHTIHVFVLRALGSLDPIVVPAVPPAPRATARVAVRRDFVQHGRKVVGRVAVTRSGWVGVVVHTRGHGAIERTVRATAYHQRTVRVRLPRGWVATKVVLRYRDQVVRTDVS